MPQLRKQSRGICTLILTRTKMHGLSDDDLKLGYFIKASGIHSFPESMEGKELTRNLQQ